MSNAEHLIENTILAMMQNRVDEELNSWYNQRMMQNTGIKSEDLYHMAQHIVYSLYEGLDPFGDHFDEVMDYYHYLKEQDHAPKYI
jgi:hypothetical protein